MLRKEEKKAITRLAVLSIGWPAGLDRFYDGQVRDGIASIIGWLAIFTSICLLSPCPSKFESGANFVSPNPLVIIPLVLGVYGVFLVIRKGFRLLRQFETSDD